MHKLPPPVEWTFATPAITSGYGAKADWAYYVTETSDKGILTAGFVEDGSLNRKPVLYKYDPFKKATLWENVMLPGSQTSGQLGGVLYDAFEFDDGNGNAYYAVGSRSTATSILRLVVAKVHPEDVSSFSGYPKIIEMDAGDSIRCRGYAMMPIINDNEFEGYMIAGYISNPSRAALIRLDTDGNLDTDFGTGGYMAFDFDGYASSTFRNFTAIYDADTIAGYVLTGWVTAGDTRDILVLRAEADGGEAWHNIIEQSELDGAGYDDTGASPSVPCPVSGAGLKNHGFGIGIGPDGGVIVSAEVDRIQLFGGALSVCDGDWNGAYNEYTKFDYTLLKIAPTNGAIDTAIFVRRFTGLDFEAALEISGSTAFLSGSVNDNIANLDVEAVVIAYDLSSLGVIWEKKFSVRDDTAQTNCIFDLALTGDGGIVVCGNNEINGDDFILAKLRTNCQLEETFDITNGITITGATEWGSNLKVKGTVRIQSGGHLNIKDATISFANTYATNDIQDIADEEADYTKIIVEEGGKLTLDGCTLKGLYACDENWMWEGIEVWGTPSQIQNTSSSIYQGHVYLQNRAVIENAIIGILADRKRYNDNGDWIAFRKGAGGMVRSDGAVFLNCRRGGHFSPYSVPATSGGVVHFIPNKSYFDGTDFTNNGYMADPIYHSVEHNSHMGVNTHASMWGTRGIRFTDCTFSSFTALPVPLRGIGIASDDARYQVLEGGPTANFLNLYRGISARWAFDQLSSITVKDQVFDNVHSGIHALNGTTHTIEDNNFVNIPDSFDQDVPFGSYGVRFDGATAYKIIDNNFETADVEHVAYGVIVDNSGALPCEISDGNNFKLKIGVQTQNDNEGLQIRCNSYQNARYAWSINPESDDGALPDQGECGTQLLQAGNLFGDPDCLGSGLANSHIYSTLEFAYRYQPNGNEIPTCVSITVDTVNCDELSNTSTCPMELPCHPCGKDELKGLVGEAANPDERKRYVMELIRYLVVTDSIGEAAEFIVDEANTDSVAFSKLAVKALISAGEYEEAETELGKMSPTDTTFQDLYSMLITIALEDTLTLLDIKPEDETMLEDIGHGDSEEKLIAQAVLEIARGRVFERYTEVIGGSSFAEQPSTPQIRETLQQISQESSLKLVPNPARNETMIHYRPAVLGEESLRLILRDLTGKGIQHILLNADSDQYLLDLSRLLPGFYYCTFYESGQPVATKPLVVIR